MPVLGRALLDSLAAADPWRRASGRAAADDPARGGRGAPPKAALEREPGAVPVGPPMLPPRLAADLEIEAELEELERLAAAAAAEAPSPLAWSP